MAISYNGWPALPPGSPKLYKWVIPGANRHFLLRNGSAGFILAHVALWYHEKIQRLDIKGDPWDEWAHAYRPVRGDEDSSGPLSNHASGTAEDLNASRYPLGRMIMRAWRRAKIVARMAFYRGCVRWGGQYEGRKDEMHFELNKGMRACEKLARYLMTTKRGKRILKANPSQRAIILS